MSVYIDFRPVENCNNLESYGEICVKCNQCGRFNSDNNKINIGSRVTFSLNGEVFTRIYDFLDGHEVTEVVTPRSPVGQAIFNKRAGDVCEAVTPEGRATVKILQVE